MGCCYSEETGDAEHIRREPFEKSIDLSLLEARK